MYSRRYGRGCYAGGYPPGMEMGGFLPVDSIINETDFYNNWFKDDAVNRVPAAEEGLTGKNWVGKKVIKASEIPGDICNQAGYYSYLAESRNPSRSAVHRRYCRAFAAAIRRAMKTRNLDDYMKIAVRERNARAYKRMATGLERRALNNARLQAGLINPYRGKNGRSRFYNDLVLDGEAFDENKHGWDMAALYGMYPNNPTELNRMLNTAVTPEELIKYQRALPTRVNMWRYPKRGYFRMRGALNEKDDDDDAFMNEANPERTHDIPKRAANNPELEVAAPGAKKSGWWF